MTDAAPSPPDPAGSDDPAEPAGPGLVNASFVGTGALVVAATAGVLAPDDLGGLTAVVSGVLFAAGMVAFLWGYGAGVVRSREETITLGGLFFLAGTAPRVVRNRMRIALLVQVAAAVAAAAIRPYTSVAFAVLAPMFGLGLMAAWGARHGTFHRKDDVPAGPSRRDDTDRSESER